MRYCPSCHCAYTAAVDHCGIDGARLVEGYDDPLIGQSIDRYQVLQALGRGAMGCVYRVRHAVLEQEHAMKVLFGDLSADHRVVERFRREAKAVSKMRHPNVVSVTDFGTSPQGLTFLVMEYVDGRTLADIIQAEAPLSPPRVAGIVRQIASGLSEAHRLELVHRDIKPANIMVRSDNGFEYVKILDFSLVGIRDRSPRGEKITGTDQFVGTPLYMAPEQALDPSTVRGTADLYSLGVILFEMLSGKPPFQSNAIVDTIVKHSTEAPPKLPPSGGLEMLAAWLLEKEPTRRPQTAEQVIAEIDRLGAAAAKEEQPSKAYVDTLEMYVEEPSLKASQKEILRALGDTGSAPLGRASPAPEPPINFEPPITFPPSSPTPSPVAREHSEVLEAIGYLGLRARLDRMLEQIAAAKEGGYPAGLDEIVVRYEEMNVAVRPGLRAYRYSDLAAKIAKLEEDLLAGV